MNKLYIRALLILLLLPLCGLAGFAQAAGTLDTQFGTNGSVQVPFLTFPSDCKAMALQTDGKIILGGQYLSGGLGNMAFTRFNTNGTLDNNFGTAGKSIVAFTNGNVNVAAVRVLSSGKIIVGGNSDGKPVILRLNANGTPDATFGTNGQVSFDGALTALIDLVIASDGKMVGCGIADQGNGKLFCAFRRNTDGSADANFGANGFAYANIGAQPSVSRLAVQSDGRVLLTGTVYAAPRYDLVLFRFNTNGTPDASFGSNGKVQTMVGSSSNAYGLGNAIAIQQQDAKIIVAGRVAEGGKTKYLVVRYNANGALDASFGTGGSVIFNFYNSVDEAKAVLLQADGRILVAGTALNGSTREIAVARLTKAGALDTSFGTGGKTTTAVGTKVFGDAMAVQSDNKILVAGSATIGALSQFNVTRYHAGTLLSASAPNAGLNALQLAPNPVRAGENLQLRFELEKSTSCQVQLFSLDGRLLETYTRQSLPSGEQTLDLKIPETAAPGQLFLRIETEKGAQAITILVQG